MEALPLPANYEYRKRNENGVDVLISFCQAARTIAETLGQAMYSSYRTLTVVELLSTVERNNEESSKAKIHKCVTNRYRYRV